MAPEWYATGTPVPDVCARSCDAEFILDSDGEDVDLMALEWRECWVPVTAFAPLATSIDAHLAALKCVDTHDEQDRITRILDWMELVGGVEAALGESPLLVTLEQGTLRIQDGYHRLGLAVFHYRASHV